LETNTHREHLSRPPQPVNSDAAGDRSTPSNSAVAEAELGGFLGAIPGGGHPCLKNEVGNMSSIRAEGVAEVLWELKRAGKVATFSSIAQRAGFSAGSNGRTVKTALKTVRRDWNHLQWWRAIGDDGTIDKEEQADLLVESGFEVVTVKDGKKNTEMLTLADVDDHLMTWEQPDAAE
jgi:methylated-DNA-protein-cysteine methyltransferase related protein